MTSLEQLTPEVQMERCIELCRQCHDSATATLEYCLQQGGQHTEEKHLRLMRDCIQITQTSLDFMLRGSSFHARVCGACADVCESCADSCASIIEDKQMQDCAEACRACATSCRDMSVSGSA